MENIILTECLFGGSLGWIVAATFAQIFVDHFGQDGLGCLMLLSTGVSFAGSISVASNWRSIVEARASTERR